MEVTNHLLSGMILQVGGHYMGVHFFGGRDNKYLPRGPTHPWVLVVSMIFYVYPYLGKIPMLNNIFSKGLKPPTRSPFFGEGGIKIPSRGPKGILFGEVGKIIDSKVLAGIGDTSYKFPGGIIKLL